MKKNFISNLIGYSAISWIAFFISFISTPILTRIYEPQELGAISIFLSTNAIFQVATLMGQDQLLSRRYYEESNINKLIKSNVIIIIITWIIGLLITYISAKWLSIIIFGDINIFAIMVCSIVSLPLSIIRMSEQLAKLRNNVRSYGIQVLLFNLLSKIAVVGVGLVNKDYNLYILTYAIIVTIISLIYAKNTIINYKLNVLKIDMSNIYLKNSLTYGLPVMISSVLFLIKDLIPRVVLRNYTSLYEVGIYGAAITLSSSINLIYSGFNTYFSAYFYENYKEDKGQINKIHSALMFALVFALIIMSLASKLIVNLLGDKYNIAGSVFPIIMLMSIGTVVSETTVYGINLANKTYIHILISISVVVSTFILSVLFIPRFDVLGASLAYGISGIIFYALRTKIGQKYHKTIISHKITWISFFIAIISGLSNYILYDEIPFNISLQIILAVLLIYIYKKSILELFSYIKILRNNNKVS